MKRLFCVAALMAVLSLDALAATPPSAGLIVLLHDDASGTQDVRRQALQATSASAPLPLAGKLGGRWHRVQADPAATADDHRALLARMRADPRVAAVLPDVREQRLAVTPNDPRFDSQWWLNVVAAGNTGAAGFAEAWVRNTGAAGSVAVAVLDSGITPHPELNPRLLPGWDFVSDATYANDGGGRDADPADPGDAITPAERSGNPMAFADCPASPLSSWHGTTIAGQIAAVTDNSAGVAAAHWGALIVPVRVAGKCGAALSDIVDGLRWAAGLPVPGVPANPNPARIIVLSYGGAESCNAASGDSATAAAARLYLDTIEDVRAAGAMVVVAAGNLRSAVGRPASCAGAFGVASLNREGYKATYSNFGPQIALATPGGDGDTRGTCDAQLADSGIVSTGNLGDVQPGSAGYVAASGTSFAAPAVAAAAALMLSVNPALGVEQLEDGLKRSARPHVKVPLLGNCSLTAASKDRGRCACTADTCGAGMLDADEALRYAASPTGYVAPNRTAPTLDDARLRECAVILGRPLPVDPAPAPEPAPEPEPASEGGGGGAMSALWVLLLGCAIGTLLWRPHSTGRRPRQG
jgi:serine protease